VREGVLTGCRELARGLSRLAPREGVSGNLDRVAYAKSVAVASASHLSIVSAKAANFARMIE